MSAVVFGLLVGLGVAGGSASQAVVAAQPTPRVPTGRVEMAPAEAQAAATALAEAIPGGVHHAQAPGATAPAQTPGVVPPGPPLSTPVPESPLSALRGTARDPFGIVFGARGTPLLAQPERLPELPRRAGGADGQPGIVCGTRVIEVGPRFDPKMVWTAPEGVDYKIRRILPPSCAP
jgi:hypothetical protein